MKILCLTSTINPESGGWGRYSHSILGEFDRQHIAYEVLSVGSPLQPASSILNIVRNCFVVRSRARSCDIVHAFDVWPFALYGYAVVLGTKKKLFASAVGTYSIPPKGFSLKRFLMVLALRRAEKVFAISDYTKKRLLDSVPLGNVLTVYMGAPLLPEANESASLYEKFDIPKISGPILLTVGQIKHRKGQLETLRAVSILKKDFPHILYLIVGSDTDTEYVERIRSLVSEDDLEENVRIIPNARENSDLAFLYSIADAFIMVSNTDGWHFEGFGLVFLEAAGFGKPVVGGRGSGIEEAMQDGYNGFLAEPANPADIAAKIRQVLSGDKAEWAKHSKEFRSRFTWKAMVEGFLAEYRK